MTMSSTSTRKSQMSASGTEVQIQTDVLTPQQTKYITLVGSDDPLQVQDVQLVQFAIAEAHSPATPPKLYPALRYKDQQTGRVTWSPLKSITSFSDGSTG